MGTLVWTENSLHSISLHLVQEYVIRLHRYKTADGPCYVVPMVYNRLQSSFVSLAWPWSGRSVPKGNQWEARTLDWGPICWAPSSPTTNDVTNLKSDRLTFLHMAGWLANCSWLADWLSNKMLTWPPGGDILWPSGYHFTFGSGWPLVRWTLPTETSCGQVCYYCSQVALWSDVHHPEDCYKKDLLPGMVTI